MKQQPAVDEVERFLLHLVGQDVAPASVDPGLVLEEAGVQIDRDDLAVRTNLIAEPARDRAATGADI